MCVVKLLSIKKKEFSFAFKRKLLHKNLFCRGVYVSLYAIKEEEPKKYIHNTIRFGLVISKKTAKAVKRNKIKRQLRSIIRLSLNVKNIGYYYIVSTYKNVTQANYKSLQKDLAICFKQIDNNF
ncbi:MAG: ribonuclease P protein component [Wolbachia endosymbiont of Menacanthus eurysternus]|nr:MAG: ribonuclease P protein component [Wolbachia endosymbiont of Menacanthus eurysternus]